MKKAKVISETYKKKAAKLKDRSPEKFKELRYKKLVHEIARTILKNSNLQVTNSQYDEIVSKIYNTKSKVARVRVKRMMSSEIAKNDINSEIMRLLDKAELNKEKLPEIYKKAYETAKSTNDFLNIASKIEKANNLVNEPVKVSETRQYNDFSKYKQDQPDKVIQKAETTTSQDNSKTDQESET